MRKSPSFLKKVAFIGTFTFAVATTSCKKIKAAIDWIENPKKTEQITNISNDTTKQIADLDSTKNVEIAKDSIPGFQLLMNEDGSQRVFIIYGEDEYRQKIDNDQNLSKKLVDAYKLVEKSNLTPTEKNAALYAYVLILNGKQPTEKDIVYFNGSVYVYVKPEEASNVMTFLKENNLTPKTPTTKQNIAQNTNTGTTDYSQYAQYADEYANSKSNAVEQADQQLQQAQQELQKVMQAENQSKQEVLETARALVQAGGNPADIPGWEEFAKRYNITPDDLDPNK